MAAPAPWKLLTALWTVYLVWGSTYLAIKLSVETLPAFLSAGSRFLLAGSLLALILMVRGRSIRVTRRELASSALLGLSPKSVDTYRSRMMAKLEIDDLASLVKFAIRHGVTSLE